MNTEILQRSILFRGLTPEEISAALAFFHAEEKSYKKAAVILHAGSQTDRMGLVLEGSVTIENNDVWGNRTILSHIGKGFSRRPMRTFPMNPCLWMLLQMKTAASSFCGSAVCGRSQIRPAHGA